MKQNRVHRFTFRLTDSEREIFEKMMKEHGYLSISRFIKARIFEKNIRIVYKDKRDYFDERDKKLLNEFSRIGNNYNQVVKKINQFGDSWLRDDLKNELSKLQNLTRELSILVMDLAQNKKGEL